ncbi:DENN domain-containing protein 1B isoform X4 [Macrobrachium rosenbergii]|uniref:DENN domain-containing protein 1B isoform X4 n=1 Tax=Macrobrachium rosenbergii TaxID=79674 RepID=UPI0034D5AE2C
MGSRLRENPRRLFECWCEVVGPKGTDRPPWIIQKFPDSYSKEEREKEILKSVPQFAFPCSFDSTNVQHFSFVLTSLDSKWTYGFCRHAPGSETALVILSHLPWHETFYKLLNHLADLIGNERTQDMTSCLQSIYCTKVPLPGSEIAVPYGDNKFFVAQCPNHLRLPTIPENRNLSEYYNAVDANNMMIIFASMLHERRIIMVSKRLSRLSACVQAANSIIYPMQWQHIFIPVLPEHLTDYLLAPMPYLIGVNSSLLSKVQMEDIGEAVILDADNNVVKTPFNDLETLPDEVIINLRRSLKNPNNMLGDHVARAFLRALVQIIGNYKEALQFREEDSKITFNREKFVNIRPNTFQPFVEKMLELQIFRQFIEERLDRLNSGKQTSDEFELEVSVHCEKSSSKMRQQYKQFVTNVRKEGGAIMKSVKSKTNPAVKSAVKTVTKGGKQVKEKSRQTYKDIRGKIKEIHQPRIGDDGNAPAWVNGDSPQKPRSAPSSPVMGVKRRPRTVGGNVPGFSAKTTYKRASQINIREDSSALPGTRKYELIESGIMSPSSDSLSTPSPQSIDLMGEMEEIIKAKLGDDFEELASSRSNDSIQSSISSSAGESPGSGSASGSASTITVRKNVKDHPPSGLTAKKQLSASLTSLPLIDLSLNIELPPPIMASFGYRFPVTFDDDSNGGGEDGDGLGSSSTSHFRSPKLLHDTDFTAPEADNSVVDSHLWGHTHLPSSSTSHSTNDGSNISADGNGQDLIFLESPQDEIFDPLLSKDITPKHKRPTQSPPPIPTTKSTSNLPGKLNHKDLSGSASTSHLPSKTVPHPALARTAAINTTGLPNATPNRTSEYRPLTPFQSSAPEYRPFSTLQTNLGVPVGCQNPIYNQHKPLGEHPLPNATRSGSATAAFATSMLSRAPEESSLNMVNRPSPYVQFEPPMSHATKGLNSSASQPQRPPRLSQKDLLGDFSKDFQKLSVNSPSRAASPANNNNTILNNNKTCDAIHAAESDSADRSETKWATFD